MRRQKDYDQKEVEIEVEETGGDESLEPEAEALAPSVDELQNEIERLRAELKEEKKRADEEHDRHLRSLADFSNYKRRHTEEYKQAILCASQELILKILPVIDNFQRALEAAEKTQSFDGLLEGVRLTLKQLGDILEREGIQQIKAAGEQFDPTYHEAVMRVETDEYPENTVIDEFQPGYTQHDKVIRPAKVRVAVLPE
ncbi:MAG: nucleotide exchange factor GrpE [Armatimonadota bacterium]